MAWPALPHNAAPIKQQMGKDMPAKLVTDNFYAVPHDTEVLWSDDQIHCPQPSLEVAAASNISACPAQVDLAMPAEDTTARECLPQPRHSFDKDSAASNDATASLSKHLAKEVLRPETQREQCHNEPPPRNLGQEHTDAWQKDDRHIAEYQEQASTNSSRNGYTGSSPAISEPSDPSRKQFQSHSESLQQSSVSSQPGSANDGLQSPVHDVKNAAAVEGLEETKTLHTLRISIDRLELQESDMQCLTGDDAATCWLQYTFSGDSQVLRQDFQNAVDSHCHHCRFLLTRSPEKG